MKIIKLALHIPDPRIDQVYARTEFAILRSDAKPGWQVKCALADHGASCEISRNLITRLRSEFQNAFQRSYSDEGYDDEQLWTWLTYEGITLPWRFSTFTFDPEPAYLTGVDLPEGVDILLSESVQREFQERIVKRSLYGEEMECHPIFRLRSEFSHKDFNFCFVLMPFRANWSDRVWKRHLQPAITRAGFHPARADDFLKPGTIVEDIWEKINTAGVVIADLTGRNPNVFYELGIAHTVGTPAILITQDEPISSFDIAHLRQIQYSDNSEGCEQLEIAIEKSLNYFKDEMRFPRID